MDIIHFNDNNITTFNDAASLMWLIYIRSSNIKNIYPEHDKWFETKVLPYLVGSKRSILTINKDGKTIGYSILKHEEEHKICTLEVLPEYRKNGYGKQLLIESCKRLKTPIISCSDSSLCDFIGIFNECNFQLVEIVKDQYINGHDEYYFKGI